MCTPVFHNFQDHHKICMISMLNNEKAHIYQNHVATHISYAKNHRLLYSNECFASRNGVPPTYNKISVVEKWVRSQLCRWLWWVDSDIAFVNMNYNISNTIDRRSFLIMTDHHAALNNGAFVIDTKWSRLSDFLQSWKLANLLGYPFTDNGSMLESIMQFFFPIYKRYTCPKRLILECFHSHADKAMGPIDTKKKQNRFSLGFKTVYPLYGFNNHPCPSFHCNFKNWSRSIPGSWGWNPNDVYKPPRFLKKGVAPMFAVHHKNFSEIIAHVF